MLRSNPLVENVCSLSKTCFETASWTSFQHFNASICNLLAQHWFSTSLWHTKINCFQFLVNCHHFLLHIRQIYLMIWPPAEIVDLVKSMGKFQELSLILQMKINICFTSSSNKWWLQTDIFKQRFHHLDCILLKVVIFLWRIWSFAITVISFTFFHMYFFSNWLNYWAIFHQY